MKITPQSIPDVLLIEPRKFGDARGKSLGKTAYGQYLVELADGRHA
jgi:hypothetical protein